MKSQDLKQCNLPDKPGVYFFRDSEGKILYIGKATSLKDRVQSYFGKDLIATRGPAIVDMVVKAHTVTFEITDSVLEALIAEANLIKQHQPYYNTKEKDDKSFYHVVITNEPMPKVLLVRERNLKKGSDLAVKPKYIFGPFPNGHALRDALKIIRKIFPFIDKQSYKKDQHEFYRQLGLTPDTTNSEAKKQYAGVIENIKLLFEGKKGIIVKRLHKRMMDAAKRQEFETASAIKRTIFALEHIRDVSLIKREVSEIQSAVRDFRIEAFDVAHTSGTSTFGVMTVVVAGEAVTDEYRSFVIKQEHKGSDAHALQELITRRLNHPEWTYPRLIVADGGKVQKRIIETALKEAGLAIPVVSVVKDERHRPKAFIGTEAIINSRQREILLANSEAHRFSLRLHRNRRAKTSLGDLRKN